MDMAAERKGGAAGAKQDWTYVPMAFRKRHASPAPWGRTPSDPPPLAAARARPHEDKVLETVLARLFRDPDRVRKIADLLPGKDLEACTRRIRELEEDIGEIENGSAVPAKKGSGKRARGPRKKPCRHAVPWTKEEHRWFLLGLEHCGRGDWRSISRNFVYTRSPTQVASHAQKFFLRRHKISQGKKGDRRRASINDITSPMDFSPIHYGSTDQAPALLLSSSFSPQVRN
ncbi:unnamed protein product [Ostreobium quekettii]|uniref:Uncharacterized protein n=1 Tax=Ostreobium quekettii TaxID=121088 RepID=A0A8S1IQ35_9CHLO|nr:unnamed protein product [Ostreobium quekettii]|eukprot:evm.model.scf_1431.1 EVM.evm.TU.scf_1431.1   scf_1431:14391-17097(-)